MLQHDEITHYAMAIKKRDLAASVDQAETSADQAETSADQTAASADQTAASADQASVEASAIDPERKLDSARVLFSLSTGSNH
ncbi:MAG: hypothetical protein ACAF41_19435 [Leptolyngbya sp. BL-A-14]